MPDANTLLWIGGALLVSQFFPALKPILTKLIAAFTNRNPTPGPSPDEPNPDTKLDSLLDLLKLFINLRDKDGQASMLKAIDSYKECTADKAK